VKKFLLFFIFIPLFACESILNKGNEIEIIKCPSIFFSTENSVYTHGETDNLNLEKIDYKASLNNYGFLSDCISDLENNNYILDLLILVEPINPKDKQISLPIFAILYNNQDEIIDKQYFRINDNLKYLDEKSEYISTEVKGKLNIIVQKNKNISSVTVGFVKLIN
tara:strand:+ start:241 stop:738 length:498 start_codon:yes stop_codon:yes gene_type:complete